MICSTECDAAIPLLVWLHKDALIAALEREISAQADNASALTGADREVRIAEAEADLLATQRDICALIWRGQADGLPLDSLPTSRRSHCLLCGWSRHRAQGCRKQRRGMLSTSSAGDETELAFAGRKGGVFVLLAAPRRTSTGVNESAHHSAQADQA